MDGVLILRWVTTIALGAYLVISVVRGEIGFGPWRFVRRDRPVPYWSLFGLGVFLVLSSSLAGFP